MISLSHVQSALTGGDNHHDHHQHHVDVRDGGDGASLLLQSSGREVDRGNVNRDSSSDPIVIIEAAIERLRNDVGAIVEPAVVAAFTALHNTDRAAFLRLRHKAKETNKGCLISELDRMVQQSLPGGSEEPSTLDELIALARQQCDLKHDADRKALAVISRTDCREVWRIHSTGFEEWLRTAYWRSRKSGVPDTTMKAALATIAAAGINDGEIAAVHLRAAKQGASYLVDLCDDFWRVVRVMPGSWQILDRSPVYFTRTQSMRPLPEPVQGGDIGLLWRHVNIPANRRVMVLTWLLDSFRPDTPFPVLELVGEQGSAKSTTQTVLRSLVDPNKVALRGRPKSVEDIFVAGTCNWLVSYENLSSLSAEQQDAICTLSTGGGFASRQLYTNGEEHVMETKRPVVLNGIAVVATRPDLIDRVIHVDMPTISPEARRDEADATAAWERDRPVVFGALLDLFAEALRILPTVHLAHKQRMADFERFGEAVARALGFEQGEFQRQYAEQVRAGIDRALESNAVAQVLDKYFEERISPWNWQGTAGQLYDLLNYQPIPDRSTWPKSPKGLADQLRRIAPAYRAKGIEISHLGHSREGALWRIATIRPQSHLTAMPSGAQEDGITRGGQE